MKIERIMIALCIFIFLNANWSFSRRISMEIKGSTENINFINEEPLVSCSGEETINLSETGLLKIPERMVESSTIRSIRLRNNSIAEFLPTDFEGATNLQCLDLSHNKIPSNKLLNFQQDSLRTLIAGHQHAVNDHDYEESIELIEGGNIMAVPYTIDATESILPNLEHLDLSGIDFRNFPYVKYPRLTHLYLNDRPVREISQQFFEAVPLSLRSVHLKWNNIEKINITNLAGIKAMYLDGNLLGNPAEVHLSGTNINILSLSNCGLMIVNSTLLRGIPYLRSLDLSSNMIQELDKNLFLDTPFLESLSLSKNKFSFVPTHLLFSDYLNSLSLSYNNIGDLSHAIPWSSLKKLSLRGNRITSINQNAFSSLFMLQELDLAKNQLQSLRGAWLGSLSTLHLLDLSFNQFTQIADAWVAGLPRLEQLFMQGNLIKSINELTFRNFPENCTVYII